MIDMLQPMRDPSMLFTDQVVVPPSYIIFGEDTDGDGILDIVFAKNGKTGQIDFQGTDASKVIQSAIDTLSNGGIIIFKNGIYHLSSPIRIDREKVNSVKIKGESMYYTILRPTFTSGNIVEFDGGTSSPWLNYVGLENIKIGPAVKQSGLTGLFIRGVKNGVSEFKNIYIMNVGVGVKIGYTGITTDNFDNLLLENIQNDITVDKGFDIGVGSALTCINCIGQSGSVIDGLSNSVFIGGQLFPCEIKASDRDIGYITFINVASIDNIPLGVIGCKISGPNRVRNLTFVNPIMFGDGDGFDIEKGEDITILNHSILVSGTPLNVASGVSLNLYGKYLPISGDISFTRAYGSFPIQRKRTVTPDIGVNDTYGTPITTYSYTGQISWFKAKITVGGTFATGETVTVLIRVITKGGVITDIEKSFTSTGSLWLTDDDILSAWTDNDTIQKIVVKAKTDQASTSVTVTVDLMIQG